MLRVTGRKGVELETSMRNFAEREVGCAMRSGSRQRACKLLEPRASELRLSANCAKSKRFLGIEKKN